jgi:hypothetical protein
VRVERCEAVIEFAIKRVVAGIAIRVRRIGSDDAGRARVPRDLVPAEKAADGDSRDIGGTKARAGMTRQQLDRVTQNVRALSSLRGSVHSRPPALPRPGAVHRMNHRVSVMPDADEV